MNLGYTVDSVRYKKASGFFVGFDGITPSLGNLGTVIGWAKIEQRKAGRACFDVKPCSKGLLFQPIEPVGDNIEKYWKDLFALIESIGFDIAAGVHQGQPLSTNPRATASEQSLAA